MADKNHFSQFNENLKEQNDKLTPSPFTNRLKKIAWTAFCLANLLTVNAFWQSSIKDIIHHEKQEQYEKPNKIEEIENWLFKSTQDSLYYVFKKSDWNKLYFYPADWYNKKSDFAILLNAFWDKREKYALKNDFETLYEHFDKLKHKIITILSHKWIRNYKDFQNIQLELNWFPLFLTDIKNAWYIYLEKEEKEDSKMMKMLNAIKILQPEEKALLVFNEDYTMWAVFLVNEEEIKEKQKLLNEKLSILKTEIDSINLKDITEPWYIFENKDEEILAKIYYYIVSNYSYCHECLKDLESLWWNNWIDILSTKRGICDAYAKAFVYFARLYWLDVKREIGVMDLFWTSSWNHAWNSYKINWKTYYFDSTNEKVLSDNYWKMDKFWKTKLFKIPEEIAKTMLIPGIFEKEYDADVNKKSLKEKLLPLKDKIEADRKNNIPYIIHFSWYHQKLLKENETKKTIQ